MGGPLKILVPLDFHGASLGAFRWAASLARGVGGELLLLSVVEEPKGRAREADRVTEDEARAEARRRLKELSASRGPAERPRRICVLSGNPAERIVRAARDEGADLIAMGSRGRRGFSRALMGSVAEGVLRRAPCAVAVLRDGVRLRPGVFAAAEGTKRALRTNERRGP